LNPGGDSSFVICSSSRHGEIWKASISGETE
jgi:hypothetical protein